MGGGIIAVDMRGVLAEEVLAEAVLEIEAGDGADERAKGAEVNAHGGADLGLGELDALPCASMISTPRIAAPPSPKDSPESGKGRTDGLATGGMVVPAAGGALGSRSDSCDRPAERRLEIVAKSSARYASLTALAGPSCRALPASSQSARSHKERMAAASWLAKMIVPA